MADINKINELSQLLGALAEELDLTESMYKSLEESYNAIGEFIAGDDELSAYKVEIHPQGSLLLGTAIRPIAESDDVDVDLVCELRNKYILWTQSDVKKKVGDRLKSNDTYKLMLDHEGRRCWTLKYRRNSENPKSKYHLDILPAIYDQATSVRESVQIFSRLGYKDHDLWNRLAMRMTDKKDSGFYTNNSLKDWPKTNPLGYALWFRNRCNFGKREVLNERQIDPMPKNTSKKSILQRVVQLLKRHRDMMFQGDDDKPISIIITTLAAYAYNGESSIYDALHKVAKDMKDHIGKDSCGKFLIQNPINNEENFADKWVEHPERKEKFFKWLKQLEKDIETVYDPNITWVKLCCKLQEIFGEDLVNKIIAKNSQQTKTQREQGELKMSSTGVLGTASGINVSSAHTFFGNENT